MRVRAIGDDSIVYAGYYNMVRRKPGDVFDLLRPSDFSETWMENVLREFHSEGQPERVTERFIPRDFEYK